MKFLALYSSLKLTLPGWRSLHCEACTLHQVPRNVHLISISRIQHEIELKTSAVLVPDVRFRKPWPRLALALLGLHTCLPWVQRFLHNSTSPAWGAHSNGWSCPFKQVNLTIIGGATRWTCVTQYLKSTPCFSNCSTHCFSIMRWSDPSSSWVPHNSDYERGATNHWLWS